MKHESINLLKVNLRLGSKNYFIGRLAIKDKKIWFEYDDDFLKSTNNLEISPFKLPLNPAPRSSNDDVFDGLFGVFNDSLPDGWGRMLIDRQLRNKKVIPETITALDRLAHVGEHGMGALVYEPDLSIKTLDKENFDLDYLAKESASVLEGEADDVVEELLALNGSSSGARPKIVCAVDKNKKNILHGLSELKKDYEHWLIKFSSGLDPNDVGAIEYAYSLMAKKAGLEIMPTHLFKTKKSGGYFGVKRFDREGNERLHVHTVSGLLHADHRYPSLDYDNLLKTTLALTKNTSEVSKVFRLAAFNVFAHNRDDHSKNFSFIMNEQGEWRFAPAYDLIFSYGPGGEHSMMVNGEGKNPGMNELMVLAKNYDIKDAKEIIHQVKSATKLWNKISSDVGVSKKSRETINKNLINLH